jgi:UDP-N-acetylglucosamine 2-epimerase (non-hydrolysing)
MLNSDRGVKAAAYIFYIEAAKLRRIILVVGARPNFMKAAPLYNELKKNSTLYPILVHTGQHYDYEMSQIFFEDLELPEPHYFLNVGSGSHAEQTAKIMIEFEKVLIKENPNLVVVFGDVNSTIACGLTAKKMLIKVAHVEAGLRSYDETMPEEINRRLTDNISDILFTHCEDANRNLEKEGFTNILKWEETKDITHSSLPLIINVGNTMIDSLKSILNKIDNEYENGILKKFQLNTQNPTHKAIEFGLITLHRPGNVDEKDRLIKIFAAFKRISKTIPLIFPIHPRTRKNCEEYKVRLNNIKDLIITYPLSYKEFITLEKNASFVLTDSGGIQEETTYLGVPCFTLRPNTERLITITMGSNKLVTLENLVDEISTIKSIVSNNSTPNSQHLKQKKNSPPLWDGNASYRINRVIEINKN